MKTDWQIVTLMAEIVDGRATLIDINAVSIAVIDAARLGVPTNNAVAGRSWKKWASAKAGNGRRPFEFIGSDNEWARWCGSVIAGNRKRITKTKPESHRETQCESWPDFVRKWRPRLGGKEKRFQRNRNHPWALWAETKCSNHNRKSLARTGMANYVTQKELLQLLEKQGRRCALTNRELTPRTAALDHTTPISRGGKHHISNVQIVCRDVNAAKGTMTNAEFVAMCKEVAIHAPANNGSQSVAS